MTTNNTAASAKRKPRKSKLDPRMTLLIRPHKD